MASIRSQSAVSDTGEFKSIIYWCISAGIGGLLFRAPFASALFNGNLFIYDRAVLSYMSLAAVLLILLSIYFLYHWKPQGHQGILSIAVWSIPLTYWISSIQAVSRYSAERSLLLYITFAVMFLIGLYFYRNASISRVFRIPLLLSCPVIVFFGFMNWFGDASLFGLIQYANPDNALVYSEAVLGERLTSVFRYANTYAAFLIAFLFLFLHVLTSSQRRLAIAGAGFMLIPVILSILLTLSRSGLVMMPLVFLIIMLFLPVGRQIAWFIHLAAAAILSLLVLRELTSIGSSLREQFHAGLNARGWAVLLLISLLGAGACMLVQRYVAPWLNRARLIGKYGQYKYASFLLPLALLFFGALLLYMLSSSAGFVSLLPDSVRQRLESIDMNQHSVLERASFYKDAWRIFLDYPVFGTGGGGWAAIYEKYQSNPYISTELHSYFLQSLVQTGVFGMLVWLAFLGCILCRFIRQYAGRERAIRDHQLFFFIPTVSLLMLSAIDFNMSYAYLEALMFLCLGGLASSLQDREPVAGQRGLPARRSYWRFAYPCATFLLGMLILVVSIRSLQADDLFKEAIDQNRAQQPLQKIMLPLQQALSLSPHHRDYMLMGIGTWKQAYAASGENKLQAEYERLLHRFNQDEPYNRHGVEKRYEYAYDRGDFEQAMAELEAGIELFPWDVSLYERAMALGHSLDLQAQEQGLEQPTDKRYRERILKLYDKALHQADLFRQLPESQRPTRGFDITETMKQIVNSVRQKME